MEVKFQFTLPENEAFLRLISRVPKTRSKIKLNLNTPSGAWIYSKIKYSDIPVIQSSGIYLIVPPNNYLNIHRHFLYFSVDDQIQINRFLKASFQTYFLNYFVVCRMEKMSNHNIITSFIKLLKLNKSPSVFEKLLKMEYRERQRILKNIPISFLDID